MVQVQLPGLLLLALSAQGLRWRLRWQRICLQCRKSGFNPWVGKIPWRKKWLSTPVFLLGESHGQRSLVGYSPWGHKESDTTEQLTLSLHVSSNKWRATKGLKESSTINGLLLTLPAVWLKSISKLPNQVMEEVLYVLPLFYSIQRVTPFYLTCK